MITAPEQNNLPPKTRGYLYTTYINPNKIDFLHWYNLKSFIYSWLKEEEEKEKILNALYQEVINYDARYETLLLAIVKVSETQVGITFAKKLRPITLKELAENNKKPLEKIEQLYKIWQNNNKNPEEAAAITRLSSTEVVELGILFEQVEPSS